MFFYCYVDFSNIPLKKFIKFFNMCSIMTAQLSKFSSNEKPWVVCTKMYKKTEESPCVEWSDYIGSLSDTDVPQTMKKYIFFETIQKLYPDVNYGEWLEMFNINGKPSDAEYFLRDINYLNYMQRKEHGVSKIVAELDYVKNPNMDFGNNNYHMDANVFEQTPRSFAERYKIKNLPDANVQDFPELNNRNFTLFLY